MSCLKTREDKREERTKEFKYMFLAKVGSINYLQSKPRPDLLFTMSFVSRSIVKPNRTHMNALDRVYSYLAGTTSSGHVYTKEQGSEIRGSVYSNLGGCQAKDDQHLDAFSRVRE